MNLFLLTFRPYLLILKIVIIHMVINMKLKKADYLNQDYEFWKSFRIQLSNSIDNNPKIEKTIDNVIEMAKKIGVKPTARYFNFSASTVRNY